MNATVPKVVGADVELSNFITGVFAPEGSGPVASRLLLAAIDGVAAGEYAASWAVDWGRKFLPATGSCAYIDAHHLETALCETLSAFDFVAHWRAMLDVVRDAMRKVNAVLPERRRLHVLANCSDGHGHSYGSHQNVLVTRRAWNDVMLRKPHHLAYLVAFQVSSIVYTGQGKVGSENGSPEADFQLSQRADFFETLTSLDTMARRGIVNTRDEPHCGSPQHPSEPGLARLHVIFFDSTLCQVATLLRVGTLQMIAAMLEAGCVAPRVAIDDPLDALQAWSRDVSLQARARMASGDAWTALDLQREFLAEASRFAARGGFEGIVPEADAILALWDDTLSRLERRDFDTLSRRLDWVLKHRLLCTALDRSPALSWRSAGLKEIDQMFASLDEADGVFWALERAGEVDRIVSDDRIARARVEPPENTRAWTRAHLLRRAGAHRVSQVSWDRIGIRTKTGGWPFLASRTVYLPSPLSATRADNERLFINDAPLEAILEALGAVDDEVSWRTYTPVSWTHRTGGWS